MYTNLLSLIIVNVHSAMSIEITPYQNNLYQHKFYVHSAYHKFIIGTRGKTINQLSKDNGVYIKVLSDESNILIRGDEKEKIICARQEIDQLILNSNEKLKFTHFVSIPINADEIKLNFENFKEEVLKENSAPGLVESMFVEVGTLHLTVTMLLLLENEDKEKAVKALHECKKDVISSIIASHEPLTLILKGIQCMQSNPAKAKVLYIQLYEDTGCLQEMCDKIFEYFLKQGLTRIERNKKSIKLHVTIAKSSNLLNENQKVITTFDASNILNMHKDTYFGKITLTTLHLSQLGTRDETDYYESLTTVDVTNF